MSALYSSSVLTQGSYHFLIVECAGSQVNLRWYWMICQIAWFLAHVLLLTIFEILCILVAHIVEPLTSGVEERGSSSMSGRHDSALFV